MSDWGQTLTVSADVALSNGGVLEGDLHLMSRTAYPPGPETPLDMLNRPEPFFALTLRAGGVAFVCKAQVIMVGCAQQQGITDPDRVSAAKVVDLAVTLYTGEELRGCATIELPPSRARALDFMNGPGCFFPLVDGDVTRYLNKAFTRLIRPLD